MKKIISLLLALCLTLTSCQTVTPGSVTPVIEVAVLIAANQYARKNPDNVGKILDIVEILNLAADVTSGTLTKEQFVSLVQKVDVEWGVLGVALYNFYAENVTIPQKYEKHGEILRKLATILQDSVLGIVVNPAK